MRLALATLLLLAMTAAPATAAAPRVQTLVVARDGAILGGPKGVRPARTTVAVGRARCRVPERTPLAALAALRRAGGPRFTLRRFGGCGGLYVSGIAGRQARGRDGWVYKVGRRAGTAGAADPSGPFGAGRLRAGARVLWFWCVMRGGGCQRTLEARPSARTVRRGGRLRVTVRGYDDFGRGRRVRGAVVRLAGARAVTDARGVATLRAPRRRGGVRLRATREAMVPAFPTTVRVR